ncbi:unnamed protein product [Sphagnum balticum]
MAKRALLVGCNYPGTQCELKGCVNDVDRMRVLLVQRFGFRNDEILQLVDDDPSSRQPTGANIRQCLAKLIQGVRPGDAIVFHFSGHGTQIPAESGIPEDTGYEECIVPSDMNLLSDDDFREIVNEIPPGVSFTFIADSCHSGGLIDHEKQQVGNTPHAAGPSGQQGGRNGGLMGVAAEGLESEFGQRSLPVDQKSDSSYSQTGHIGRPVVNKSLDIGTLTQILSQRTQHDVKVGNIRTTLYKMFGEDASPMVKVFVNVVLAQLQVILPSIGATAGGGGGGGHGGLVGKIGSLAAQFLKIKVHDQGSDHVQPAVGAGGYGGGHAGPIQAAFAGYKPPRYGRRGDVGILISACESDEASADARPTSNPKHAYGALSNAIQTIVGETQGLLTNRQLVFDARKLLAQQGYKQHPCLFSSDQNADAPFICR